MILSWGQEGINGKASHQSQCPRDRRPLNLCIAYGNLLLVSGLPPFDEDYSSRLRDARARGQPLPPFPDLPFEQQMRIVMEHMKALLESAGSNMDEAFPARTRMQAGRTPMDCALEIEAIAYVPQGER